MQIPVWQRILSMRRRLMQDRIRAWDFARGRAMVYAEKVAMYEEHRECLVAVAAKETPGARMAHKTLVDWGRERSKELTYLHCHEKDVDFWVALGREVYTPRIDFGSPFDPCHHSADGMIARAQAVLASAPTHALIGVLDRSDSLYKVKVN